MNTFPSLSLAVGLASIVQLSWAADEPNPPVTTNPALAGDGVQIGVGRQDGITVSADGASVTRNGITEKLSKELYLPSGVVVRPNGSVTLADKTETTLRVTQILTFDGKIVPQTVSPNVNPGDPRGNGGDAVSTRGTGQQAGSNNANMAGATGGNSSKGSLRRDAGAANGSVFLDSDGVPFMGALNPDGTLLRADGMLLPADGSYRAVTFGQDGTPALGTVNANGSITRADGSTISADGSVRSANGTLLSPANQNTSSNQNNPGNLGSANNGNSNPGNPQQNGNSPVQPNNGAAAGRNANSPNNTGTVNRGTNANGQSQNNTGNVNNTGNQNTVGGAQGTQNSNQSGATGGAARSGNNASGGNSGGGRAGGSSSGGTSGGGASGGGASGGSGGGAPR
jgi:hypothetical protein